MRKGNSKKGRNNRRIAMGLVLILVLANIAGTIGTTNVAEAAEVTSGVTPDGVIFGGNGTITEVLSTGATATVTLTGSVINIMVGSTKYVHVTTESVGSVVISEDELLHIFWHMGYYYVIDLRNGRDKQAYKNKINGKYCLSGNLNSYKVKGVKGYTIYGNTAIYDKEWFEESYYETIGGHGKERLMTRAEFEKILDGKDPSEETDPTPTPTITPTTSPTASPTPTPTVTPTTSPTASPTSTPTVTPTTSPTASPTPTPTASPTVAPTQEPTPTPTASPSSQNDGNNSSSINVPGNSNNITVTQNITQTVNNVDVDVNGNDNIVGVNAGVPVATATAKAATTTTTKTTTSAKKARVITSGNRKKLYTGKNKLHGWLEFNKKTGKMNWNGCKMSNVKSCGFIKGSWNIIVLMKDGKVYKLPKTVKKGETVAHRKLICKNGKGLRLNPHGFVIRVRLPKGGLKKVSGL